MSLNVAEEHFHYFLVPFIFRPTYKFYGRFQAFKVVHDNGDPISV
jgi:hypothetical protein